MTHDPTSALPLCGARRPGWGHGPAIGRHRIPCLLGTSHDGDHRDGLGQSWPPSCEDCGTTSGPLEPLSISTPDGEHREGHLCGPCGEACALPSAAARTATVYTLDRGPVTVPCPTWCLGTHEDGLDLVDLAHEGPKTALTIPVALGATQILDAGLCQYPYSSNPDDRGVKAAVLLGTGWHSLDPDGLRILAAQLVVHAGRLRDLAAELRSAEGAL